MIYRGYLLGNLWTEKVHKLLRTRTIKCCEGRLQEFQEFSRSWQELATTGFGQDSVAVFTLCSMTLITFSEWVLSPPFQVLVGNHWMGIHLTQVF